MKALIYIAIVSGVMSVMYFFVAFSSWDWNPVQWDHFDSGARAVILLLTVVFSVIGVCFYENNKKNDDNKNFSGRK